MSCLNCKRAKRCSHVREVAFSIFMNVRVLSDSARLFEITAESCDDYSGKRARGQLELFI